MLEDSNEIFVWEIKSAGSRVGCRSSSSFKRIRKIRKKNRLKKNLLLKKQELRESPLDKTFIGPTKETAAKLRQDPLVRFKVKNILNDQQIWAFQRIRHAVKIITAGTHLRTSRFTDVVVQTGPNGNLTESEYEIKLKDHYSNWIDRMTTAQCQAGPVLDIIIDELSLNAADRKWGKRKGWAKARLQASLDLYGASPSLNNRDI